MSTSIGVLLIAVYIVAVIALAAGLTWLVVRFTPAKPKNKPQAGG